MWWKGATNIGEWLVLWCTSGRRPRDVMEVGVSGGSSKEQSWGWGHMDRYIAWIRGRDSSVCFGPRRHSELSRSKARTG